MMPLPPRPHKSPTCRCEGCSRHMALALVVGLTRLFLRARDEADAILVRDYGVHVRRPASLADAMAAENCNRREGK